MSRRRLANGAITLVCVVTSVVGVVPGLGADSAFAGDAVREEAAPVVLDSTRAIVEQLIDGACAPLLLTASDLTLRADAVPSDPFRLPLVESSLIRASAAVTIVDSVAAAWTRASPVNTILHAVLALDPSGIDDPPALDRLRFECAGDLDPTGLPRDASAQAVVSWFEPTLQRIEALFADAASQLSESETQELVELAFDQVSLEEVGSELSIDALAAEERAGLEAEERFVALAERLDRAALHRGVAGAAHAAWSIYRAVEMTEWGATGAITMARDTGGLLGVPASGDVRAAAQLADGSWCVIGGSGPTFYDGPCTLVIDLGGDDVYRNGAGAHDPADGGAVSIVVDLAGDDLYHAGERSLACGVFGAGVLIDVAGQDVYISENHGLGAGLIGLGALIDLDGDDRYAAATFAAGAGCLGVGLLHDRAGGDLYQTGGLCQGFGFVGGVGLLDDRSGSDVYICQSRYADLLRNEDTSIHLAQGFGYGLRPLASGGIGLLVDRDGHDRYVCEVFGQGSAYWYGLGGLIDARGNDRYEGYNYAQGAGVHIAVGVLVDGGGDDAYLSRGISQGAGHDLAIGMLVDLGGDDRYDSEALSQGAGNANGIGILIDRGGTNRVGAGEPPGSRTLGYGNFRRHFGSVGLAIFADGSSRYLDPAAGSRQLWGRGTHGAGVDATAGTIAALAELASASRDAAALGLLTPAGHELATAVDGATHGDGAPGDHELPAYHPLEQPIVLAEPVDLALADQSVETLFWRAARGEPRFREQRDQAFAELVRRQPPVAAELGAWLGTRVARQRHTLKDLFRSIGDAGVAVLITALGDDDPSTVQAAAWCLERMEAQGAAPELERLLAQSNRWRSRAAAAQALGRCGRSQSAAVIGRALKDEDPTVRKAAAYAVGEQVLAARRAAASGGGATPAPLPRALTDAIPALVELLDDDFYGARFASMRALAAYGPWASDSILAACATAGGRSRALLIDALGFGGDSGVLGALRVLSGDPVVDSRARIAAARLGTRLAGASDGIAGRSDAETLLLRFTTAQVSELLD